MTSVAGAVLTLQVAAGVSIPAKGSTPPGWRTAPVEVLSPLNRTLKMSEAQNEHQVENEGKRKAGLTVRGCALRNEGNRKGETSDLHDDGGKSSEGERRLIEME